MGICYSQCSASQEVHNKKPVRMQGCPHVSKKFILMRYKESQHFADIKI